MIDPREEFKDIMRELAQEETRNILQNEDIYQNVMGTIISENENDTYTVDLVSTTLHNIINQTGVKLKKGDTVMVSEKYGSNYSNCYISAKAGGSTTTVDEALEKEKETQNQLGGLSFAVVGATLQVTFPNGQNRYINFDK